MTAGPVRPVCVLVGAPGVGKSTVGALVARALGVPHRDTDTDIERLAGKPVPEIFADDGEDRFRALERQAVATALATFAGVLSLGSGAILAPETREALRGHTVVYLAAGFAEVVSRVGLGHGRPLLAVNPRATLRHLLDQRRPLYEQVTTMTVETDGRTPEAVTAEIVAALRPAATDHPVG